MKKGASGRFTRLVRGIMESIWNEEELKLGQVNRWNCRDEGWGKAQQNIGFGMIWELLRQRFDMAEQRVLKSNQSKLREAIDTARRELAVQTSIPGIYVNELHTQLSPIAEKFVKVPGPDKDFSQLVKIRDLDFDVIYDMAVVRDEKEKELMLSIEDYNFMDHVRMSINVPRTTTMHQAFAV